MIVPVNTGLAYFAVFGPMLDGHFAFVAISEESHFGQGVLDGWMKMVVFVLFALFKATVMRTETLSVQLSFS